MTLGAPFARCTRCSTIVGVMRVSDARAGGWLAVLDRTCPCGASAEDLVPTTNDEAVRGRPSGAVLPIVMVPDGWPEK